ncbi:MAG TPA: hypothetical protein ACFYD7_11490 [Candidatus Wujingus californicus]
MNRNQDITHKNKAPEERNICLFRQKDIVRCVVETGLKPVSAL